MLWSWDFSALRVCVLSARFCVSLSLRFGFLDYGGIVGWWFFLFVLILLVFASLVWLVGTLCRVLRGLLCLPGFLPGFSFRFGLWVLLGVDECWLCLLEFVWVLCLALVQRFGLLCLLFCLLRVVCGLVLGGFIGVFLLIRLLCTCLCDYCGFLSFCVFILLLW